MNLKKIALSNILKENDVMMVWKIVDERKGKPTTLFHGNEGSKTIPLDEILLADRRVVSDGSRTKVYESGFHVLKTLAETINYLGKFTNLENKRIVRVWVPGYSSFRPKDGSPAWLVGTMVIPSGEWKKRMTKEEAIEYVINHTGQAGELK